MEILAFTNRTATLQSELEEAQKTRQQLEHIADEATQEDSEHSLHLGQILMSVENLFLRCTTKRPAIQHANEMEGILGQEAQEIQGGEAEDPNDDSYKRKTQTAVKQLLVILAYLKDFKDIAETLKKERKGEGKQRGLQEVTTKLSEPEFKSHDPEPSKGSGSVQNTKDFPQRAVGGEQGKGNLTGGVSGLEASVSATIKE